MICGSRSAKSGHPIRLLDQRHDAARALPGAGDRQEVRRRHSPAGAVTEHQRRNRILG